MPQSQDKNWTIKISAPFGGYAPLYWEDTYPIFGNANQAGDMAEVDLISPNFLKQGPGLATLTAGDQAGSVTTLIRMILDRATADNVSYAVGQDKIYTLSATAVTAVASLPANSVAESILQFQASLYTFYNDTVSGNGDIRKGTDDDWGSTEDVKLANAPHPSLEAADKMLFGNGRYVGTYDGTLLDTQDLDFKADAVVVDLAYTQARYWIAVNWPNLSGNNRNEGRIYIWNGEDGSWEDDIFVGGRIGCIWAEAGTIFCVYRDVSNGVNKIGYVSGNRLVPITGSDFYGDLPLFYQKTKYKNHTLLLSGNKVFAFGASTESLPAKIFPFCSAGYTTGGGIACPFGTPLIASNQTTSYKIAKISGYSVAGNWKSLMFNVCQAGHISIIDKIEVHTNRMTAGARVDLTVRYNQGAGTLPSSAWQISTASTSRHVKSFGNKVEDFRIELSWANGSATYPANIKEIYIKGHYLQND